MKVALKMCISLKHGVLDIDAFQTIETKFELSQVSKVLHSFLNNYLTYREIMDLCSVINRNADDNIWKKYKSLGVFRYKRVQLQYL